MLFVLVLVCGHWLLLRLHKLNGLKLVALLEEQLNKQILAEEHYVYNNLVGVESLITNNEQTQKIYTEHHEKRLARCRRFSTILQREIDEIKTDVINWHDYMRPFGLFRIRLANNDK